MFRPKQRRPTEFCSRACKDRARGDQQIAERTAAKSLIVRHCVWCGETLDPMMRRHAHFCSARCNSAAHKMMRRMAKRTGQTRSASYMSLRVDLAQRDGLTCYLCGTEMSLTLLYPEPLYASVDHVLALANGGTNDATNLRLAHLVCNERKHASLV